MDATHLVWITSDIQQAAAAGRFGTIIRAARSDRGLTLADLGRQLGGYSVSTLSRIETGHRKLTDINELRRFARCLHIPATLFGLNSGADCVLPDGAPTQAAILAPTTVSAPVAEGEDSVRRRDMLTGLVTVTGTTLLSIATRPAQAHASSLSVHLRPVLSGAPDVPPVTVAVLRAQVAAARRTFDSCLYRDLAMTLPRVISTAQAGLATTTGVRHDQTAGLLADAYALASELCSRLHDDSLAWVTAERASTAAHASGDVTRIAEAARMTSIAMRRHGHHDTATTLLTRTALDLGADTGEPRTILLATYGSLLCTAAYTAAQHGNRRAALDLISEADTAASRLGDTPPPNRSFSPTNVAIYRIGVHTTLGDAGTALDYASKIHMSSIPTAERRARYCLDTARAWNRFGNPTRTVQALQLAERCAPEELHRSTVRSLITSLLSVPGPTPTGLPELAARYAVEV